MSIQGYLVPINAPADSLRLLEAGSLRDLCRLAGIEYAEVVRGDNCIENDFVALVDEDGIAKHMEVNFAASNLTGYPGYMYGPCLLVSQRGPDLISLDADTFRLWCSRLALNYTFH